jgi:hypothetical protein
MDWIDVAQSRINVFEKGNEHLGSIKNVEFLS